MRSLPDIVADNRVACQRGVVEPGSLVGTTGVKPYLYTVKDHSGNVLATDLTDLEVAKRYNQIRGEVVVEQQA